MLVLDNQERFQLAVHADLGRPFQETTMLELGPIIKEALTAYKKVDKWAAPERVPFDINTFAMGGKVLKDPQGVTLIIGPFNYPLVSTIRYHVLRCWLPRVVIAYGMVCIHSVVCVCATGQSNPSLMYAASKNFFVSLDRCYCRRLCRRHQTVRSLCEYPAPPGRAYSQISRPRALPGRHRGDCGYHESEYNHNQASHSSGLHLHLRPRLCYPLRMLATALTRSQFAPFIALTAS